MRSTKTSAHWDAALAAAGGDRAVAAVGILRESQKTHRAWVNWLQRFPRDARLVGDAAFHQRAVDEYERIIETIQDLAARR